MMAGSGLARTFGLYFATAIAELVGCYLPLLWWTGKGGVWLLAPAALSLVDGVRPTWTDIAGVALALCGAAVIALGQRTA
jgi:small multidrug resistance family-3 protein